MKEIKRFKKGYVSYALYECHCGNLKEIRTAHVKAGKIRSCGCLRIEKSKERIWVMHVARTKTGLYRSSEYTSWCSMKQRCTNPKNPWYKNYGDRGITICDRWLNSFENFIEDMGRKPTSKHTIERKNNAGNYEPNNCVWATRKAQQNNTRQCRKLEYMGNIYTFTGLCEKFDLNRKKAEYWLYKELSIDKIVDSCRNIDKC